MIKLLGTVPHKINIAFSGGVDSLVAAHFFKKGNRDITLLHFNHGCEYSDHIQEQCVKLASQLELPMEVGQLVGSKPAGMSKEDFWRKERYKFLRLANDPTITCHHLDDAIETWLWSSCHGTSKLIPRDNGNIVRPFLLTTKASIHAYAARHSLVPVDDPYNLDTSLVRNYIRANMVQHAKVVNPGIEKVIRKKYLALG